MSRVFQAQGRRRTLTLVWDGSDLACTSSSNHALPAYYPLALYLYPTVEFLSKSSDQIDPLQ